MDWRKAGGLQVLWCTVSGRNVVPIRYPPYDEKAINYIRNMLKNRWGKPTLISQHMSILPRALPNLGWMKSFSLFVAGAAVGYHFH